ncbi:hypothetical protein GCM10010965_27390 [Caldalkalibacillus thermarum]|uniref:transcription termination/antitermination NusG family protein n=1 Tax=Caldalkalibacillus thermarum TaxID=296745 RepID=UPI00166907FE|nr:transcription termination/antitermination NusG family protein [Caldalkalibacillus thermarum]GGK33016.1 hypothetical protein GCM10010965_27390 [Caldalkalibacillus thermarum]
MGRCVYAVQVVTGKEFRVKNALEQIIERYGLDKWIDKIHAFETNIHQYELNQKKYRSRKKSRSAVPGYVFIEFRPDFAYFPKKLWHLIKNITFVIRVVDRWYDTGAPAKYSGHIPKEEFDRFARNVDTESQAEVWSDDIYKIQDEQEQKEKEVLHQINTGKYPKENKSHFECNKENECEQEEHSFGQEKPSHILQKQIEKCKVFLKRNRIVTTVPSKLFNALRQAYNFMKMPEMLEDNLFTKIILELISPPSSSSNEKEGVGWLVQRLAG